MTHVITGNSIDTDEDINPSLEQCVGLLPKPGCGREPVESGDRGGAMQLATFGVLIAALVVIGVRIARAVVARDKSNSTPPHE
ncbi:MAG: hypothetical protein ACKOFZ_05410 [Ilumatobacteraceae bacterium]|jgi:hypothetical protein